MKSKIILSLLWLMALWLPQIGAGQGTGTCTEPANPGVMWISENSVCEGSTYVFGHNPATLVINSPYQANYQAKRSIFGPAVTTPITGNLVIANDGVGSPTDACQPIQNGGAISGNIAVIDRGSCAFVSKVLAAEAAGAIAVVIVNTPGSVLVTMADPGGTVIHIPTIIISYEDGQQIKNELAGGPVSCTIPPDPTGDLNWQFYSDAAQQWITFYVGSLFVSPVFQFSATDASAIVDGLPGERLRVVNETSDCEAISDEVAISFRPGPKMGTVSTPKPVVCQEETITISYERPPFELKVTSPEGIAGSYAAARASFGPEFNDAISGKFVQVIDADNTSIACTPIANAAAINGNIAVIDRGSCAFVDKVQAAQDAGAIAVVVVNNQPGDLITMGGSSATITIPAIFVSQADGDAIKAALTNGEVGGIFPAFTNDTWQYYNYFEDVWVDYAPVDGDLVLNPGDLYTYWFTSDFLQGHKFRVAASNAEGCVGGSNEVEIGISTLFVFLDGQTSFCGAVSGPVTLELINFGSEITSYLWSPGGETTSSITIDPVEGDVYTVTAVDGYGCSATLSRAINVIPPPVPVITQVQPACDDSPATLRFSGTKAVEGCTNDVYGQFPAEAIDMSEACDLYAFGYSGAKAGEYSLVNVEEGKLYKFYSENDWEPLDDIITITDATGSTIYATGKFYAYYLAGFTGQVRFYTHEANCATPEDGTRTRFIRCFGNPDAIEGMFQWMPGGETTSSITANPLDGTRYSLTFTDPYESWYPVSGCSATSEFERKPNPIVGVASAPETVVCEGLPYIINYKTEDWKLTVNSPAGITGNYDMVPGAMSASVATPLNGKLVLVNDGISPVSDGCSPIINAGALAGNIAVIDRGTCAFVNKVLAAQNAGAIAVVMVNNVPGGGAIIMGGTNPAITIPAVMISLEDGNAIKTALQGGDVNVTIGAFNASVLNLWQVYIAATDQWVSFARAGGNWTDQAINPNTTVNGLPGDRFRVLAISPEGCVKYSNEIAIGYAPYPVVSITPVPENNVYTGGSPTTIYLGYGPQSLTLMASANIASTFSWTGSNLSCTDCASPVFTPTAAGTYSFEVTATSEYGCTTTETIEVCVKDIRVPGQPGKLYMCHYAKNKSQTIIVEAQDVQAHWKHGDALGTCGQACEAAPATYVGKMAAAEPEVNAKLLIDGDLTVFPNPATQQVTVRFSAQQGLPYQLSLTDMLGRTLEARSGTTIQGANQATFQVGNMPGGPYLIRLQKGKETGFVKFIKQ